MCGGEECVPLETAHPANRRTENFQDAFDTSSLALDRLPLAFYSGMFAFGGWFYVTFVTEEVVNPKRTIPISMVVSLIVVTICYLLTNVAYYTVLSPREVLTSKAVAMSFAEQTLGPASPLISILVAMSCFGALNGGIFASSRMLFAAAREGHWPPLFSMIHIRRHTPLPALILMMPLVLLMIGIGDLYGLLNFYSFSRWLFMGMVTFGLIIHRRKYPDFPRPFKVPLIIPTVFSVMCLFIVGMSLYSDPINTGIGCLITLTGVPVYYLTVQKQRVPQRWATCLRFCDTEATSTDGSNSPRSEDILVEKTHIYFGYNLINQHQESVANHNRGLDFRFTLTFMQITLQTPIKVLLSSKL